jgi:archaellum biogenesis ATPase FlaH
MELEKQILLIEYLVASQELFVKVSPILKINHWDPKLKNTVKFIISYFDEYKIPPTIEQIKAETGKTLNIKSSFTRQELTYAENQLERFCREKAIEAAIIASPALLDEGKYGEIEKLIKDAITVGLSRNIGLDYFFDPEARLRLLTINNAVSTGWHKLDEYLGGGLNRKEMIIFAAPPGVGKSLTMGNLAKNLMKQHLNGVFITLELAEEVVGKRFDSMFSGMQQMELMKNITQATIKINQQKEYHGTLHIKRMPESSTNANHIRAYLKEFEIVNGYLPDFIVVDYLDLMCSVQSISAENTFIRDKFISEELRSIANEFNLIMVTASQLNRSALQVDNIQDIGQANIAGGISKINTTDNLVAIIQNDQMKARGEMMFKLLKTRSSNGVGNFYLLKFNQKNLCLENLDEEPAKARMSSTISAYIDKKNKPDESDEVKVGNPTSPKSPKLDVGNLPFQV